MRFITEPFISYSPVFDDLSAPKLLYGMLAAIPSDGVSGDILTLNGISSRSAYLQLLILPRSPSHSLTSRLALNCETSFQFLIFS